MRFLSGAGRFALLLLAAALIAGPVAQPAEAALPGCAAKTRGGGDWPMYGRALSGARFQPAEHALGPDAASRLAPVFAFSASRTGLDGIFQATPVERGGCLYMGTSTGWVIALNADTGHLVWRTKLPVGDPGLLGVGVVGSTAVDRGRVFVNVSQDGGPYAAALDQATGRVLWRTTLDKQTGAYNDASPVVFDGLVFAGFVADESQPTAHGGYVLLDQRTGEIIAKHYAIPDADFARGYAGGGIWATPAIDTRTRYAYVGTGNPSTAKEHPNTDAILKIDLDRRRATFGQIVGSAKGTPDDLGTGGNNTPTCQATQGQNFYVTAVVCPHADVDYGASPQLFRGPGGREVVGELQKSGVYHAVYTDTMKPAWDATVGAPAVITNGDTAATDGKGIYVVGTPPGQMTSLAQDSGAIRWLSPTADVVHFQAVTVADGVVYTVDGENDFRAFDAGSGQPLLVRPMAADDGADTGGTSYTGGAESTGGVGPSDTAASVSVARHTVYVATGGDIVAYRPQ
jgi:polyvinyl alcohol dehydrogenase (cytochrome)